MKLIRWDPIKEIQSIVMRERRAKQREARAAARKAAHDKELAKKRAEASKKARAKKSKRMAQRGGKEVKGVDGDLEGEGKAEEKKTASEEEDEDEDLDDEHEWSESSDDAVYDALPKWDQGADRLGVLSGFDKLDSELLEKQKKQEAEAAAVKPKPNVSGKAKLMVSEFAGLVSKMFGRSPAPAPAAAPSPSTATEGEEKKGVENGSSTETKGL